MMSLEFFIDIILPAVLWLWGWTSLQQKCAPGIFPGGKGGRCIGLTTLPPSCADCLEIWDLNLLVSLRPVQVCNGFALPLFVICYFWVISRRLNFIFRLFETLCLFHLHRQVGVACSHSTPTCLWRWNTQSVSKRRHIKFRRREITQKKTCNIKNTAKVWNQE
jgi:hypothetical protein